MKYEIYMLWIGMKRYYFWQKSRSREVSHWRFESLLFRIEDGEAGNQKKKSKIDKGVVIIMKDAGQQNNGNSNTIDNDTDDEMTKKRDNVETAIIDIIWFVGTMLEPAELMFLQLLLILEMTWCYWGPKKIITLGMISWGASSCNQVMTFGVVSLDGMDGVGCGCEWMLLLRMCLCFQYQWYLVYQLYLYLYLYL